MYEFIVLGLIPGTQIRLTFGVWLFAASMLPIALLFRKVRRTHLLRNLIIGLNLLYIVRRQLRA